MFDLFIELYTGRHSLVKISQVHSLESLSVRHTNKLNNCLYLIIYFMISIRIHLRIHFVDPIRSATSTHETISSSIEPPLLLSGANY